MLKNKITIIIIIVIFLLFLVPKTNVLATYYSGKMNLSENWNNENTYLKWEVNNITNQDGYWTYKYIFSSTKYNISHFIVQVSDTFTDNNILEGTTTPFERPKLFEKSNPSNPGIPYSIYGLKFECINDNSTQIFCIVTDRDPMPGIFYAKGAKDLYDYGHVLVPDSIYNKINEPNIFLILFIGFIGLLYLKRKVIYNDRL